MLPNNPPAFRWRRFAILLVTIALPLVVLPVAARALQGSSFPTFTSSPFSSQAMKPQQPPVGWVSDEDPQYPYQPGSLVNLEFGVILTQTGSFTQTSRLLVWYPPQGATGVTFPDVPPEPGGPPYEFDVISNTGTIDVGYLAPNRPEFTDWVVFSSPGNVTQTFSISHCGNGNPNCAEPPDGLVKADQATLGASEVISVPMWSTLQFIDVYDIPMTPALCQEYVEFGQSENMFIAWRVPVADALYHSQAYAMPFQYQNSISPTLSISGGFGKNFSAPLEIRPLASTWAAANLPAAPGEMWVALGVKQGDALSCPADFNFPADWSFVYQAWLDLSSRPDACQGCSLPAYACYKTEGAAGALASLLAAGRSGSAVLPAYSYADGFTCLGPSELALTSRADWRLEPYTLMTSVSATEPITVHYWINNYSELTQTLTLEHASSLTGANWELRPSQAADSWTPDLTHTLGSQIQVAPSGEFHIWMLTEAPANASGQYTMTLTASTDQLSPAGLRGTTTLWVGELPDSAPVAAAVQVGMSAAPEPVQPGGLLTYTLTVDNSGPVALTGLVITDTLPANTTYQACSGADSCSLDGNVIRWSLANLGAGQARELWLSVRVNPQTPIDTLLRNLTYGVSSDQGATASGSPLETRVGMVKLYLPAIRRD